jgi:hypothetical protein
MTTDQIIYFFNHLVDQSVDKHTRGIQAFVFIGIPSLIGIFIISFIMKQIRGNKLALNLSIIALYLFSIALPLLLVIHSLIYLKQLHLLSLVILLFGIFALVYLIGIEEYYPRYSYKTDTDYLKFYPLPNGCNIVMDFPCYLRLQILNIFYACCFILAIIGFSIYLYADKNSLLYYISVTIIGIGGYGWLVFLAFIRWYVRCPLCHRTVYGTKKANNKTYFICTIRRIFMYHRFTCMYCFAHIKVGDRDIIAEKKFYFIKYPRRSH